jgi:hypothetical protein
MDQPFSSYSSVLVPVAITLIVVIVLIKIVIAIEHAVIRIAASLLTIIFLGALLIAGFSVASRLNTIQNAAAAAVQGSGLSGRSSISAAELNRTLNTSARNALVAVGLNPQYLHLVVRCNGPQASLHMSYHDSTFLFGVIDQHDFVVPIPMKVRC